MEHTIAFKLAADEMLSLITIAQKPCPERATEDLMEFDSLICMMKGLLLDKAKEATPADIEALQKQVEANKRNTADAIVEDWSNFMGSGLKQQNKGPPLSFSPNPITSGSYYAHLKHPPPSSLCCESYITIYDTRTNKTLPLKIYSTSTIISLALKVQFAKDIPLHNMKLLHNNTDIMISARASARPLDDFTKLSKYSITGGELIHLEVIARPHMPEGTVHVLQDLEIPFTSQSSALRAAHALSTIEESPHRRERPRDRTVATHKLVERSYREGALSGVPARAKHREDMGWAQQEGMLRKAQSLGALRHASPVVSPVSSPVGLGIGSEIQERGRQRRREVGSPDALSYRVPDMPSPPVREKRRDSVLPSAGSPIPSYMRPTAASRRERGTASPGQQQPARRSGRPRDDRRDIFAEIPGVAKKKK